TDRESPGFFRGNDAMNHKQRKELRTLAEGLLFVPEEKFTLGLWGEGTLRPDEIGFECDYAGCAVGWAPKLIPGCGLTLKELKPFGVQPVYNGKTGFDAVEEYFGLTYGEACFLFNCTHYDSDQIGPNDVSARILAFLEDPEIADPNFEYGDSFTDEMEVTE